jgi:archaeal flagellin FlaB
MLKRIFTQKRYFSNIYKEQKGITGLETAIILIAFVVVAAVFAYTVLSAGLFATQKSQEAVYNGLGEAQSTLELKGGVVAYNSTLNTNVSIGKVEITLASGGSDKIDLTPAYVLSSGAPTANGTTKNRLMISYNDANVALTDVVWTVQFIGSNNSDYILDLGEKAVITIWLHSYNGTAWSAGADGTYLGSNDVDTYHTFTLEVKPDKGASLTIQRTTPAGLTDVVDLH